MKNIYTLTQFMTSRTELQNALWFHTQMMKKKGNHKYEGLGSMCFIRVIQKWETRKRQTCSAQ